MKIAIYSPYLDTLGGGERYILTIAECLSKEDQVDLLFDKHLWDIGAEKLRNNLSKTLNINLLRVRLVKAPLGKESSFLDRLKFLHQYDFLFYATDGSIFLSTAKNNVLHFQVPFKNTAAKSFWGLKKLNSWKKVIYNSNFTKDIVEKNWPIRGQVIYPPVDIEVFTPLSKKSIIITVGRFFNFLHNKKQEVLIDTFSKMIEGGLKGWKLILVGGTNKEGEKYIHELKKKSKNIPVEFYLNTSFEKIRKLYGESSIYWHAAGFGEKDPMKMEHFGISTVEAMAAGAVPVVINLGGQKEIVEDGDSGFLWNSQEELIRKTEKLIEDDKLLVNFSKKARERSKIFSKEKFCSEIFKLTHGNN